MLSKTMINRRKSLALLSAGVAGFMGTKLFAEDLIVTPAMTEGPFYPDKLPIDTDNDLLVINNSITPAVGEITYLSGTVSDSKGNPLRNAFVEIWQVDHKGVYLHSGSDGKDRQDKNFQGYGRFLTDVKGQYCFRTVKPVPYPGRTPHIHVGVSMFGRRVLTTQLFVKGHEQNERDGLFRAIRDEKQRDSVTVDFAAIPNSKLGELNAEFNIVLGVTPDDADVEAAKLGIGKSDLERSRRGR